MLIGSLNGRRVLSLDTSFERRLEMSSAGLKLEEILASEVPSLSALEMFQPGKAYYRMKEAQ